MNVASLIFANQASLLAAASRGMIDGQEHMIVPLIAIREGVLNNIFYSANELMIFANAWNGVPIPVTHPKDEAGNFITANSPAVEETHNIGKFYNVNFDASKKILKGELWINIKKATDLGHQDLITRLDAGEQINVSTGLWTNAVESKGEYQGKSFEFKATNIRPDHLAILPNELGACSVKDGCGTFIHNCEGNKACKCADKPKNIFANAFNIVKKALGFEANEISHSELRSRLSSAISSSQLDSNKWSYIVDVYDKFFVYELDSVLLKQGYAIDAADQVTLIGDAIEVFIEKTYKAVSEVAPTNNTNNTQNMKSTTHLAVLAGLLAANTINAEQEAAFKALPDEAFDAFLANSPKPAPVAVVPENVTPITNGLNDEERELLNILKADRAAKHTSLVAHVKENFKTMAPEVIDTMNVNQLEALAKSIPASNGVVNYSLLGGAPVANQEEKSAYTPPSILTAPVA